MHNKLTKNFIFLFLMQMANLLLPLISLPYLSRVLQPEGFGLIVFAQSFIQYFVILTDFGFNLSATRQVSIYREDPEKLKQIFNSVLIIKLALVIISFVVLVSIVMLNHSFSEYWYVYLYNFGIVIGNALFPIWLFQGLEVMQYSTLLNVISKLIFTLFTFILVKDANDLYIVPILNSIGFIISGILGISVAFRKFNMRFQLPQRDEVISALKDSAQFFVSRASVSLYTTTNTFLIGIFLGKSAAGYYAIAEKLINVIAMIISTVVDAIYPFMAKTRDLKMFNKIFKIVMVLGVVGCLVAFIISEQAISIIFGANYQVSVTLFNIMLVSCFISIPSMLIGYPLLAAFGNSTYPNYSVLAGSIVHIVLLLFLIQLGNIYVVASILIVTQLVILSIRYYGVRKIILRNNKSKRIEV
ncbi:teichoic acid transporter [Bacillus cereus]|uniref:Teichoic acid transporter n=1 Tax=Bacillus cereus TaxID=1396 RepID=A0A1S9TMD4_BACCE|nr:flippase [Bacillus cereus]OOR10929.1 teichoic acid transporter [Bacillus cereus]